LRIDPAVYDILATGGVTGFSAVACVFAVAGFTAVSDALLSFCYC
jgi:hypothetical protein